MKTFYILVATLAAAAAVNPQPKHESAKESKCIPGCKCTFVSPYAVKVSRCSKNISLSDNVFANLGMEEVNTIEFAGAVIDNIVNTAFNALSNVEIISFKNCHLNNFESDAFDLPEMDKISFVSCSFINATVPVFNSDELTELVMAKCNLLKVPVFGDLPSLETLDLSDNYIRKVSKNAFEELDSLETLKLSKNNITVLPPDVFFNNRGLTTLYLDNNPLRFFNIDTELSLEFLSLSSCRLSTFDHIASKYLSSLNELDLSNNKIAFLPNEAVEKMKDLITLDLSENNLKHLDVNVFRNNRELKTLKLDKNHFKALPPFVMENGTFSVAYFSCRECEIKTLSKDTFKHMPSIQTLDLSNNEIDNIDNFLKDIPALVKLDLSGNKIVKIGTTAFSENHNIKTLKLRGNPLFHVSPKIFSNNKVLEYLDMSETDLVQIWNNNKTKVPSLKTLFISDNKIENISPPDLKVTPNLKYIYLENNNFVCSRDFKDALRWLDENKIIRVAEKEPVIPDFIGGKVGKTWRSLGKSICPGDKIFEPPEKVKEIKQTFIDDNDDEDEGISGDDNYKTTLELEDYSYDDDFYDDYDDDYTTTQSTHPVNYHRKKTTPMAKNTKPQQVDELDEYEDLGYDNIQAIELESRYTLTKTSYVILVTSVFILTAFLVVIVTVGVTVLVLRQNGNNVNMPRFKIPLWSSIPAQKKHSGSVYHTLTEEYSAPRTPQVSRYEFKSTPAVHTHSSA